MIPPILTNANDVLITALSALITLLLVGLVLALALTRPRKRAKAGKRRRTVLSN